MQALLEIWWKKVTDWAFMLGSAYVVDNGAETTTERVSRDRPSKLHFARRHI